jgi:hypothetical protein
MGKPLNDDGIAQIPSVSAAAARQQQLRGG